MTYTTYPKTSGERFPPLPGFEPRYPRDPPSPGLPAACHIPTGSAPKETYPLAAEPQQRRWFSKSKCPICDKPLLDKDSADFIGNLPCVHRGPCTNPECIQAYYGTTAQPAVRYHDNPQLYCQKWGCGKRLQGWCLVKAVADHTGREEVIIAEPQKDLEAKQARTKRQDELRKKEEMRWEQMRPEEPMTADPKKVKTKKPATARAESEKGDWRKKCGQGCCGIICCPCLCYVWCTGLFCDECSPLSWLFDC
ncbi:hypothetical protein C8A05DRAFT_32883 [Staphylotrichum tortipilum]|uniref:Uncharacterized protein n=1 Tax=Staphylotrichum tortipilum TaxID=2831512 RepID=A0AAN6MMJ2_9PEZI|nr:hypothetical protein C8A05DRAFT_32883 [Staphylotrichum longicolle]